MRVEITERRISTTDPDTGQHYVLQAGDVVTVPDTFGTWLCAQGWATDVEGKVPTGQRDPRATQIQPQTATLAPRATEG